MSDKDLSFEEIEAQYKALMQRIQSCQQDKMRISAELASRKRQLKETMEEVKKSGFNPDNLSGEIQKAKEVLITKMQLISADLDHAESVMKPMIDSIEHS